jgi:hypothetical protein
MNEDNRSPSKRQKTSLSSQEFSPAPLPDLPAHLLDSKFESSISEVEENDEDEVLQNLDCSFDSEKSFAGSTPYVKKGKRVASKKQRLLGDEEL